MARTNHTHQYHQSVPKQEVNFYVYHMLYRARNINDDLVPPEMLKIGTECWEVELACWDIAWFSFPPAMSSASFFTALTSARGSLRSPLQPFSASQTTQWKICRCAESNRSITAALHGGSWERATGSSSSEPWHPTVSTWPNNDF